MNLRKINDSEASRAAEKAVSEKDVMDLYINGAISVNIPGGIPSDEFAQAVCQYIEDNWGEPDVNFDYGPLNLTTEVVGNKLSIRNN